MALFGPGNAGSQTRKSIEDASEAARHAEEQVVSLREQIDHLTLITQALWELLKQKQNLTDQELMEMIRAVDLLDGKADGRYTRTRQNCPPAVLAANADLMVVPLVGSAGSLVAAVGERDTLHRVENLRARHGSDDILIVLCDDERGITL